MGIIQSLPIDSYLDRHQCSGRNITWHYIHTNGSLPAPYSHCPYASAILSSHCCSHGTCTPSWFDREFERYGYGKWDRLGDPYNRITNCTVSNWNNGTTSTSDSTAGNWNNTYYGMKKSGMCLGMEPSLWFVENHWPPLGVDGRPVKNFEALRWGYLATDTYGGETRGSAMGWNASVRSCSLDTRTVTSDAARQEAGALWSIPAKGLAVARSLHKRTDDLAPLYILPSIIFGIPTLLLVGSFLFYLLRDCLRRRSEAKATEPQNDCPAQAVSRDPQNNDPASNPEAREPEDQNGESPPTCTPAQNNGCGSHDNSIDPPPYGLSPGHIPLQDLPPYQSPEHASQAGPSYSSGQEDPQENA